MRYLVEARVKPGKEQALVRAIDAGTLGRGSIAGDEYLHNMRQARANANEVATVDGNMFLRSAAGRGTSLLGKIF